MALTVNFTARLEARQTGSNDFGNDVFSPVMQAAVALASGTDAGQADILWLDEREIPSGSNDDIDLAGELSDAFGATVNAAEIVGIFVFNQHRDGTQNTTDLTIGAAASNAWEGLLGGTDPTIGPIKPGNFVAAGGPAAAGIGAVTAGSADILRVANSAGAAATYQIAIIARSA